MNAPHHHKKQESAVGPMVAMVIIVVVMIIGAIYFLNDRLERQNSTPSAEQA